MSEITVLVNARAKPGRGPELLDMYGELAAATHGEEGCLAFTLHRGLDDHDVVALVERWASKEALDGHIASPHLAAFRRDTAELFLEPSTIIVAEPVPSGERSKGLLSS